MREFKDFLETKMDEVGEVPNSTARQAAEIAAIIQRIASQPGFAGLNPQQQRQALIQAVTQVLTAQQNLAAKAQI